VSTEPYASTEPSASTEPFAVVGLHHLQLAVPPEAQDACRRFWVDLVGLAEVPKPPALAARGGAWFRAGRAGGAERGVGTALEIHLGVAADVVPATKAHPAILVDGLDALADRLTAAGVPVRWDADFPGHRHFYCADPAGNRLEFLTPDPPATAPG
jgi:catechol 2,3-dioxygenase-like lactoylglutathione lyase family enzyme